MMNKFSSISFITLLFISIFIAVYRINTFNEKEISWDVLGYYLYLPATFVHHDPMLNDISWLEKLNNEKHLTGTLYMISSNQQGEKMYFFLMGMAFFYLPFFLIGHQIAAFSGFQTDGFSLPYQYSLVIGAIIYTIIGLIFLRKILKQYFSDNITSLTMIIVVFGTNYINHLTIKNLETVNIIFMLVAIIILFTINWHDRFQFKYLLGIGICAALLTLVKPSEVVILLIPLLWNVDSFSAFKNKINLFYSLKKQILLVLLVSLVFFLPQMVYWYMKTGLLIYDSYNNPGVGLDIYSPHILDVLFSYRKGWLVYTPVMIFALFGFYFFYNNNKKQFIASFVYFAVSFLIISSWSEWWYGAGFSVRPLIAVYPVLAVSLGYFLNTIKNSKLPLKITVIVLILFFIFLNQFQWWQLKKYILDPYRTTKEYYWATFLKTSVSEKDKELLLVERNFSGINVFANADNYKKEIVNKLDFNSMEGLNIITDTLSGKFYRISGDQEFYIIYEGQFRELTEKDHAWIRSSLNIQYQAGFSGQFPILVMTMDHKGGAYGYSALELKPDSIYQIWNEFELTYLTPEPIRSPNDRLKCYIWNRGKLSFDIDNVQVEVYERK